MASGQSLPCMGVHLGDVILERDAIYGDTVGVAARTMSLVDERPGLWLTPRAHAGLGQGRHGQFEQSEFAVPPKLVSMCGDGRIYQLSQRG